MPLTVQQKGVQLVKRLSCKCSCFLIPRRRTKYGQLEKHQTKSVIRYTVYAQLMLVGSVYKAYRIKPVNGGVKTIPNIHITDNEEQLTTKDVSYTFLCWSTQPGHPSVSRRSCCDSGYYTHVHLFLSPSSIIYHQYDQYVKGWWYFCGREGKQEARLRSQLSSAVWFSLTKT